MLRRLFLMFLIAVLFASPGCGGGGGNGGKGSNIQSDLVTVSPSNQVLVKGNILQLIADRKSPFGTVIKTASFTWTSSDAAIATVDANGLVQGIRVGVVTITAASGAALSGSATVGVVSPNQGSANLILSGSAFYEDKPFDANGFTGLIDEKPIRNAVVEAVAIDGFVVIGTGSTDNAGNIMMQALDNSIRRGGVYLRVLSKTLDSHKTKVMVKNNKSVDGAFLCAVSPAFDDSQNASASLNIFATTTGSGGAFNILDALFDASEFVQLQTGCPSLGDPCIPPLVKAFWEPGSSAGTFYDGKSSITILGGGGGDADEYDDSVIIHEYGHFILSKFSHDDSLGGQHSLTEHDQDIRLSWSEGWANFFSSAVRKKPFYVDIFLNQNPLSFNIEDYSSPQTPSLKANAIYTTSEVAVAGVLWDAFDSAGDSSDTLSLGFAPIWKTLLGMSPKPINATMEAFWLSFKDGEATSTSSAPFQLIMGERQIELAPDNAESPASESPLTAGGAAQHHTLYFSDANPAGDTDIIPFTVSKDTVYTLKTLNLTNGADTLLEIKDLSGNLIPGNNSNDNPGNTVFSSCTINPSSISNCPRNGPVTLAASITFTWTGASATLKAHVSRPPGAPPSAGLFGAYDIQLSAP